MKILSINHKVKDNNTRLLQLIKKGDRQAFAQVFSKYQATCYNAARAFLLSHELSRKAVEDIFIQVWIKRAEIEDLQNFIFSTAKEVTIARLRELADQYFEDNETRSWMKIYWDRNNTSPGTRKE